MSFDCLRSVIFLKASEESFLYLSFLFVFHIVGEILLYNYVILLFSKVNFKKKY